MGTTPWTHTVQQGTARQLFLLRAEGYRDQEVWCDESASSSQTVSLVAEPKPLTAAADADGGVAGSAPVIVMQAGQGRRSDGISARTIRGKHGRAGKS